MITNRKEEHVQLAISGDVGFRELTNGLEEVRLPYNALPELNFSGISTEVDFLGKRLSLPLIISGMTGGYPDAERINTGLAESAAALGIAMGVGSMRAAFDRPETRSSYTVLQSISTAVPVITNIGAVQLAEWYRKGALADRINECIELVGASVVGIHINPLQEMLQPEGEPDFSGVLEAISAAVDLSPLPVMVKEVGAGISGAAAHKLVKTGVACIDVAGAGGTSWAAIEIKRHQEQDKLQEFREVGISTAECIRQVAALRKQHPTQHSNHSPFPTIVGSGGISSGYDIARALYLGADLCATARPVLQAFAAGGTAQVIQLIGDWTLRLRQWMFITGAATPQQLTMMDKTQA
ncbi:MAG: type 2 isopentenyl-diphosphate Delta-isomerase [Flavobacteriales bacterium]|nr:MAG: Isopentenyl-diphosphate delta-isomerase [Microgenomates bacterium OLB23]MBE2266515.1 type 2 isopentenyl-diphosphate Delta-isomerase [Flavobacteriales bacterium]